MKSNHTKYHLFIAAFMACIPLAMNAQTSETDTIYLTQTDVNNLYRSSFKSYPGVHDPSIVYDRNGHYYIFGSHNAIARTSDLRNWNGVNNNGEFGVQNANGSVSVTNYNNAFHTNMTKKVKVLKNGVPTEVNFGNFDAAAWSCAINNSNGSAWTVAGNMWAPDIIWNKKMNKWCLYLSLNGPRWNSTIILLTSSNIEGPYVYQGPVVYTGFRNTTDPKISWKLTDLELVIGTQSDLPSRYNRGERWGDYLPHAIDPCVFYDEEGQLWMTYGSWSGGIFILKLNEEDGLRDYTATYPIQNDSNGHPLSDPYFGTQIAGGYYVSGEGSYIQHIGDYYFLFVTYGGLEATRGYTMRTFRSKNPDGPFLDNSGENAIFNRYQLNYGPNDGPQRGNLLVGAFGKWNFQANGEVAQGHNSAIVDEKGRAFLVYHTRFNTGNEWFQDRVHQLFTSENGWLLSAPMEFNGESVTDADIKAGCEFSEQQMVGEYHMLIHKFGLNNEALAIATPSIVNLTADGKIEGAYSGSWKMKEGTAYVNLKVGGLDYEGVVVGQTIDDTTLKTIGITAASRNGFMLWAYKVLPQYAVAYNAKNMTYPVSNNSTVNSHIDLTTSSVYGVKNEWYSSVPSVISNTGKYNPADTVTHIVLTNRIFAENYAYEKQFNIRAAKADSLPGDYLGGIVAYYPFDEKPIVNAYDETQRGTASKLTNGTIPDLKEDGARIGQVIQFHEGTHAKSSGSYLRMPNPLMERTDLEGITVSAWMKRGNAQDLFGTAWAFTTSTPIIATNQERLFLTLNSYIGYTNKVDTFAINYPKASNSTIPEGEWRLVTVVIDKSGIETYVNGIKRTKIFTSTAGSNITNFDMQKVFDTIAKSKYFTLGIGNGIGTAEACYDDLLIYNRALTPEDVKLLYSMERRVTDFTKGLDTSIDELMMDHATLSPQHPNQWFDLTGRKILEPTAPGIYIFNGKKVRK